MITCSDFAQHFSLHFSGHVVCGSNSLSCEVEDTAFERRLSHTSGDRNAVATTEKNDNKINAAVGVTKNISNIYHAGKIASSFAEMIGGKGGGKAEMAMAGGQNLQALSQALDKIKQKLKI